MKNKNFPQSHQYSQTWLFSASRVFVFAMLVTIIGGIAQLYLSHAYSGHHASCSLIQPSLTTVTPGKTFPATVKMLNNGTTTWSPQYAFYLADPYNRWNFQGYAVTSNIPPGHTATFNLTLHAPSAPGVYQFGAAIAIGELGTYPTACPPQNITVSSPQTPPPPPTPTPKPTPTPTPKPTPTPTPTRTPTSPSTNNNGSTSSNSAAAVADTIPPSVPGAFTATIDATTKTVMLNWQAASDNIGVTSYQLERSEDQQNWDLLDASITTTQYNDLTASFGTHYYYRLVALDAAGNASGYATTDITSTGFKANAAKAQDTRITSDDKVATILIPAGALSDDAFCTLTVSTDTLPPNFPGFKFINGPYTLTCRDGNGSVLTKFNKSLVLSVTNSKGDLKGIGQIQYFGQKDDNSWQNLKITNHNKKTLTDTVDLGSAHVFTVMGKQGKTSIWLVIFEIVLVIAGLLFAIRFIVRWTLRRRAEKQNEEYLHKSRGV